MRSLSLLAVAASYVALVSAANLPVNCQRGTYRRTADQLCYWCNPGTFSPSFAQRPSDTCPPATAGNKACGSQTVDGVQCYGAISLTECGNGSFQSSTGMSTCLTCPTGYRCPNGPQTSPIACGNGNYQPNSGQSSCITCPAGHRCPTNGPVSSPTPCGNGSYQPSSGQTTCITCPAGNQCPSGPQTSPTPCGNGSFQSSAGQSMCTPCPLGYRCPTNGPLTSPTACGNGSYQPNSGQTTCIACPVGHKCPTNGPLTSPTACSPGEYQNAAGASTCKQCDRGEYNNAHGATKCCNCCAGTYQNDRGKTVCKSCPVDEPFSAPGSDSSNDCDDQAIPNVTISNKLCTVADPPAGFPIGQGYCYPEQGGPVNSGIHINKRSLKCAKGLTRCPHLSGKGGFDCINTRTDPESCGGCVNIYGDEGEGKDCTAIPNVSVTRCVKGKCVIKSCTKRHTLSADGGSCEPVDHRLQSQRRKRHAAAISHKHLDI